MRGGSDTPFTRRFLPEDRHQKAPPLPTGRPPTRREAWEHYHAIYFDFKGHAPTSICGPRCLHSDTTELESFTRDAWAWAYVSRFIGPGGGWDKQPDWVDGDPVIPEAVPSTEDFGSGNWSTCLKVVYGCLATAQQRIERMVAA